MVPDMVLEFATYLTTPRTRSITVGDPTMASKSNPSPSQNSGFMSSWFQGKIPNFNNDLNDMNVYGSSPPGNSCITDFVKPPTLGLRQRQSAPDLTRLEAAATTAASSLLPRSAHVTPMTTPESSPSLQRKSRSGYLSDSECDMPASRRNWMFSGFFSSSNGHIMPDGLGRQPLVQISEDSDDCGKLSPITIPIPPPSMERKQKKKKSTMTKFEINAFAPTSM